MLQQLLLITTPSSIQPLIIIFRREGARVPATVVCVPLTWFSPDYVSPWQRVPTTGVPLVPLTRCPSVCCWCLTSCPLVLVSLWLGVPTTATGVLLARCPPTAGVSATKLRCHFNNTGSNPRCNYKAIKVTSHTCFAHYENPWALQCKTVFNSVQVVQIQK